MVEVTVVVCDALSGRDLISRYIKEETLVEHIIEGLTKAGMKIG